jgi:hypothetical protein
MLRPAELGQGDNLHHSLGMHASPNEMLTIQMGIKRMNCLLTVKQSWQHSLLPLQASTM